LTDTASSSQLLLLFKKDNSNQQLNPAAFGLLTYYKN